MPIQVGESLPQATFHVMTPNGPAPMTTEQVFGGKTVVLFGVPGAFTPACHRNHLPGFLEYGEAIKAKGVDTIAVTGVNDVFVMDAWAKDTGGAGRIMFLADGSADFAKALGLVLDASSRGLGLRSQRYSMLVRDGVVASLAVEESPGSTELSGAPAMLKVLGGENR